MDTNIILNNITLSEWNEEITNSLVPNIIFLSIYIALGTIGNVFVLLVYAFQMKEASEERYFIPILAFFDMIATIYLGVYYIFLSFNQTIFSNNVLCKTLVFFAGNTTYTSVFILFIIAIQRYMKVCRPQKQPMSISVKITALLLAFLMSVICALPLPFVFGTIPFHNIDYGISGMRCGRLKDGNPFLRTVYSVVAGLFVFVIVTSLIVIYGRIINTVFRRLQVNKKDLRSNEKRSETTDIDENNPVADGFKGIEMIKITDKTIKHPKTLQTKTNLTGHNMESAATKKRRTTNRRLTYKLTVMFFIITTVFLLSYIPKVVLLFLEGINEDFWEKLSASQRPAVTFLYHIFILHNIVNPIVYAFFYIEFRQDAKKVE
ncbi:cholecystokinin receptor type A-like [Mytilus trossulus]|uniref:cholecystokinin receptor type A-like n=1 Tax=Mytilus trossulus TaxID=6551 RepID=UPI003007EA04